MQPNLPDYRTPESQLIHAELSGAVLRAFYKTYNTLGFGFLESVYRRSLFYELRSQNVDVFAEAPVKVFYNDQEVGHFKLDLLVGGKLAVELKAGDALGPTDKHQLTNYLKAGQLDVGLLLHYGPDPKFHRILSPRFARS